MRVIAGLRRFASIAVSLAASAYTTVFWLRQHRRATGNVLPGPLSVTLTSYPPRFSSLALTLKSLLAQDMRPDHLYLWIATDDFPLLPQDVLKLQDFGLEIRLCEDLRSFKKIIPALKSFPNDFLVIADDDQYYPRNWLRTLVQAYRSDRREVICGRAHRIQTDPSGSPLPYRQWDYNVGPGDSEALLFPTGIGGVLYVPGILHEDVTREELFLKLCPTADDVWLYWMASRTGATFRKVGPRRRVVLWVNSQEVALHSVNRTANDEQIQEMTREFGFPPT